MRGRYVWIALAVSVAANLFLIGLLAGRVLPFERGGDRPVVGPALMALQPQRRQELRAFMLDQGRQARVDLRSARQHRRAAAALFAAPAYNRAAVAAELDQAATSEAAVRRRVENAFLDYAARLSPPERDALSPLLVRGVRRAMRPGGRQDPGPADPPAPAEAPPSSPAP